MTSAEVQSLKSYIEQRFQDLEKVLVARATDTDHRLVVLEDFKKEMRGREREYCTREELTACVNKLQTDVAALREFRASVDAKASQGSVIFVGVVSVISVIVGVVGLIHSFF